MRHCRLCYIVLFYFWDLTSHRIWYPLLRVYEIDDGFGHSPRISGGFIGNGRRVAEKVGRATGIWIPYDFIDLLAVRCWICARVALSHHNRLLREWTKYSVSWHNLRQGIPRIWLSTSDPDGVALGCCSYSSASVNVPCASNYGRSI